MIEEKEAQYQYLQLLKQKQKGTTHEEKIISTSGLYSYSYAIHILKAPFPLGERAIAKDGYLSYSYAKTVLNAPFPLGEGKIAKGGLFSIYYAAEVLKAPFPPGEEAIFDQGIDESRFAHWARRERNGLITKYLMLCINKKEHLERILQYKEVQLLLQAIATKQ